MNARRDGLGELLGGDLPMNAVQCGVAKGGCMAVCGTQSAERRTRDCTARIWNAETGSCELVLEGHNEAVCSACISPDCRYVATSSEDSSARLWYVDSGRCARVLLDHKEAVYSAAFSPDSKQVVTASEDGTAKIWVVKTGLCKLTLKGHNFAVLWAAFSPDGRSVTTTSSDGTLKIWNAKTGVCDRTLLGQKPVYLASFATDGSTFVTASAVLSTPNEGNGQFWEKKYLFVVVMGDRGVAMEVSKSRLDRHVLTKIHQSNITNRKE
ncbi:Vegetative incompatibility protein HET-E-1 [Durusdinium trenchii]|uniref:Vegetative incompatibility protein HET-E-1 n=1 Tax=Durusdinium trenchii TaxID=1381693 RepID=A0ABP0RGF7_9DINO